MSGDVVIGWVHPGRVHAEFLDSMLQTVAVDRDGERRLAGWTGVRASANVSGGRNEIVEWFLASPAEWLLMVDTDMVWQPDDVRVLLSHADADTAPIVGGLCFAKHYPTGLVWPTLYQLDPAGGQQQFYRVATWPENTLFPVGGTGAAFLLVHRGVFNAVKGKGFSAAFPWFQETEDQAGRISEDLTFCLRAQQCGFRVHVHTGVQVGHVKEHVVTVRDYLAQL